ncbi:heme peroxidase [Pluteus cervinus]|uniref:Heme peroxidase n=1 Tax=Pluteus cervinus TaxID=181527 RepID=A0ACD3A6U6_9AGAR|nr:heme peroxidase [Pluteus cervinus]
MSSNLASAPVDERKINKLIDLSKNPNGVDVTERLQIFRACNATISVSNLGEGRKRSVNAAAVSLVMSNLLNVVPAQLSTDVSVDGKPYVRLEKPVGSLPNPGDVFEKLLKASDHQDHSAGLSSLLLSVGSLISLSKSYPSPEEPSRNLASNTLDLLPLYGFTDEDSRKIRPNSNDDSGGCGFLIPDAFFEVGDRLAFLPPATSALLILFNRYHNYIAGKLLEINEQGKWVDPTRIRGNTAALVKQDDEIFKLAQRLNRVAFRGVVVNDFLKGLLGLELYDSVPSVDFFSDVPKSELTENFASVELALQYGWNSMMSQPDLESCTEALSEIERSEDDDEEEEDDDDDDDDDEEDGGDDEIDLKDLKKHYKIFSDQEPDRGTRSTAGLERSAQGSFQASDLASILSKAINSPAAAFRCQGVASELKVLELETLERSREWGVCGLNAFRKLLGLRAYTSFEEWSGGNTAVASAARELYGNIDTLELYVGLRGESVLEDGFKLGKTLTQGLTADIVKTVRSDPNFSQNCTAESLTKWGYEELFKTPSSAYPGGFLTQLLVHTLPQEFAPNSVEALFPLYTPDRAKELLTQLRIDNPTHPASRFSYLDLPAPPVQPINTPIVTPDKSSEIGSGSPPGMGPIVGGSSPVTDNSDKQTMDSHDRGAAAPLPIVIPESASLSQYAEYFHDLVEKLIKEKSSIVGGKQQVDVIQDVINAISARWVAEKVCGLHLNRAGGRTDREFFQFLKETNDSIFSGPNGKPDDAARAGQIITAYMERNLVTVESFPTKFANFLQWVILDAQPVAPSWRRFRESLAPDYAERNIKSFDVNTIGSAMLLSVSWAESFAAAMCFYFDKGHVEDQKRLCDLVVGGNEVNKRVMNYIRDSFGEKAANQNRETAMPFIEATMPNVFKAIWRLEGLKRDPITGEDFMFVSFDPLADDVDTPPKTDSTGVTKKKAQRVGGALLVLFIAYLFILAILKTFGGVTSLFSRPIDCRNPTPLQPWQVYSMHEDSGKPAPFVITLTHPKRRKVSFVGSSKQDTQFKVFVNKKFNTLSTDVRFDTGSDCAQGDSTCASERAYSHATAIIPPGTQTIKLEWANPSLGADTFNATNPPRFMWKQEICRK